MADATCSIEDCDSPIHARTWCRKHYERWLTHGDPTVKARAWTRGGAVCAVRTCNQRANARGWCPRHYSRWRRTGDPLRFVRQPGQVCSIDGCGRPVKGFGWCGLHYSRWRRHRDPLMVLVDPQASPEQRFWAKIDKHGPIPPHRPELGPCWIWTAAIDRGGYGVINWNGHRAYKAHRAAYELMVGPIPEGLPLDHLCLIKPCVKAIADKFGPAHLEAVTHAENNIRRLAAMRRKDG